MDAELEKRLAELERRIEIDERIRRFELMSVRLTASVLLEMALAALIIWSLFHLVNFVRSLFH